jgi:hypothetical protein
MLIRQTIPAAYSEYISAANKLPITSDEGCRSVLKAFIKTHGEATFLACHQNILFPIGKSTTNGAVVLATLLAAACYYGLPGLVRDLIALGVNLEAGTQSDNKELDRMSPLGIAVTKGSMEIVYELLLHDVNLLHLNSAGKPVFSHCPREAIVDLILAAAQKKNCLDALLAARHKIKDIDFLIYACHANDAPVLASLIKLPEIQRYTNISQLISATRWAAFSYPVYFDSFTRITENLLQRFPEADVRIPVIEYLPNEGVQLAKAVTTLDKSYQYLFGEHLEMSVPRDRQAAIKVANAQFYSLLNQLDQCLPYLRFMSKDFEAYVAVKTGGRRIVDADPSQYTFKVIEGIYYPIPHPVSRFASHDAVYTYHKKYSALQEFLLLLFRKHGLGEHAMKWVGHIPQRFADRSVEAGDLTFESKYSGASLLHGKYTHALQTAIMIYAIEAGEISIDYFEKGAERRLTVRDILSSQVMLESKRMKGARLWEDLRDKRCTTRVTGYDPYHFSSFIMKHGSAQGFPSLANYLIDSFCKGILQYYVAIKSHIPQIGSFDDFYAKYSRLPPGFFSDGEYLIKYAARKYASSPSHTVMCNPHSRFTFALAERFYKPCEQFVPASYNAAEVKGLRK